MIDKYTRETAMKEAIRLAKGKYLEVGDVVATEDEPRTWQLDATDGNTVQLSINDEKRTAKHAEVFKVKQVINIANHLLNLGFWSEGLESMILTIKKK